MRSSRGTSSRTVAIAGGGKTGAPWISPSSISSLRWHAAKRPPPAVGSRSGSIVSQTEMLTGQRGTNGQPWGSRATFGGEPSIGVSGSCGRSSRGTEPSSPIV